MESFEFFKTMPAYKELVILSEISKNPYATQKEIANSCGITAPMVNEYIANLHSEGYIEVRGNTTRNTTYHLTEEGKNRLMILNISYNIEIVKMYKESEKSFEEVWKYLSSKELRKILLFGAGDVGKMALEIMEGHGIEMIGFIDENPNRIGTKLHDLKVYPVEEIKNLAFDAVVITSYRHGAKMAQSIVSKTRKPIFIFNLEDGKTSLQLVEKEKLKRRN
jgi:DNA-binding MarR family transcriptional regulator|uniref:Winged helix-turn-helix transcriptional regulator n=1 Tax=Mesoaciditoga lauensis TaxID=1495039 RepID=A0A7V3VSI7_9BACT